MERGPELELVLERGPESGLGRLPVVGLEPEPVAGLGPEPKPAPNLGPESDSPGEMEQWEAPGQDLTAYSAKWNKRLQEEH